MKSFFEGIYNNRKILATIVTVLALMVSIGTTYTLISPAATLETPAEEMMDASIDAQEVDGDMNAEEQAVLDTDNETMVNENGLTAEEQANVDRVIDLIEGLPTYDQIEEQIFKYEEDGDMDAMEAYYNDTVLDIKVAQNAYTMLDENLQAQVTNYEKLQELEGFAQKEVLIDEIVSDEPATVKTATTKDFIELNLYDYGSNINEKYNSNKEYPGFQWNGGAYKKSTYNRHEVDAIDFGNSLITDFVYGGYHANSVGANGYSKNRVIAGNKGGEINKLDVSDYYGVTNRPIGMSLGTNVLNRSLNSDGYPELAADIRKPSLQYLFSDGDYAEKKNTSSIDGLFQQNEVTGAYYYNSRENFAQYGNNKFTVYNQILTPNFIVYPFGNFLPLNDITNGSNATQVSHISSVGDYVQNVINDMWYDSTLRNQTTGSWYDKTAGQLVDMLSMYRTDLENIPTSKGTAWSTWTAKNAIVDYFTAGDGDNPSDDTSLITDPLLSKLYNIDWDVKTNFFFGMEMKMTFMQPKDGMTGNDTNKDGKSDYPMEFYFTGDDDVWVYVDDALFLDLSGIHRHVGGKIDFVNGMVHYYYLNTKETGDVSDEPYKNYTFEELLAAAGKSTDAINKKGTFKDYTYHKFNFYYMERGSGSSVCRMNFNFPLIKQNSISVAKEVTSGDNTLGNPDFKFQIMKADKEGTKTNQLYIAGNTQYNIYNSSNEKVGTGTTDSNGVFTLKAGQRAEFDNIDETDGKYYVRELFESEFVDQYDKITITGSSTTTSNEIEVGKDTFTTEINSQTFTTADSPVKDISDGTTVFSFVNDLNRTKLGSMKIKKVLKANEIKRKEFDFEVRLDGELLPVNTEYDVTTKDGTVRIESVTSAGIITLGKDETAEITGIKAGTQFTVKETEAASEGYDVIYGGSNVTIKGESSEDQYVSGEIVTSSAKDSDGNEVETLVKVTNTDGTVIKIPVTKVLSDANGNREFTFLLQAKDNDGNIISDKTQKLVVDVENGRAESEFSVIYPANTEPGTYHYQITEVVDTNDRMTKYDNSVFNIEVVIDRDEDGALKAIEKNGHDVSGIVFNNQQLHSLEISKTVKGREGDDTDFKFNVKLSGTEKTDFYYEKFKGSKLEASGIIELTGGSAEITLKHGETISIKGLPAGTEWTVTEDGNKSDGYIANYMINGGQELIRGLSATSTIVPGNEINGVTFVNKACYTLPETGGIGTKPFYVGGMLLIAAACLLLMRQRRREG